VTKSIARIPKRALGTWRAELSDWTQPLAFGRHADEIVHSVHRDIFFNQAGLTFLRDAWIASRVAYALSPESVRLVPDARPDFEIRSTGEIQQFEATKADDDERRRDAESERPDLEPDPVENWRKRFEAIPTALNRVITKKLTKDYQSDVSLVIYLNLGCYGAYVSQGVPILCEGASLAKNNSNAFSSFGRAISTSFGKTGKTCLRNGSMHAWTISKMPLAAAPVRYFRSGLFEVPAAAVQ